MLLDRENQVHWGWLVFLEMFLAGIVAGAYLAAVLLEWQGRGRSPTARVAHLLAFPLMALSGALLTFDLGRPARFWHMILMSDWYLPILKLWSPISLGSWLVLIFSGFALVSFVDALVGRRVLRLGRVWGYERTLHGGPLGRVWATLGGLAALGVGIYSGALLSATNIPGWGQTTLVPAVYVATAMITGVAALVLIQSASGHLDADVVGLARANTVLIGWWLLVVAAFLLTLGGGARYFLSGLAFLAIAGAIVLAGVIPLALAFVRRPGRASGELAISAALVLVGGLLLRYAIVMGPQSYVGP